MWILYAIIYAIWNGGISLPLTKNVISKISIPVYMIGTNIFTSIAILVYLFLNNGIPHVSELFFVSIAIAGILDAAAFYLVYNGIRVGEISLIAPLANFSPLFTLVFAAFALHEIPTPFKTFGVLLILFGAYSLNISHAKKGLHHPFKKLFSEKGVLFYLGAFFIWSITPIFQKIAILQTRPQTPIFASFIDNLIVCAIFLPFFLKHFSKNINLGKKQSFNLAFIGLGGFISQLSAYTAFAIAPLGYTTAVMQTSSLFAIIVAFIFLKERNIKERLFGASIMILGTVLLAI